MAVELQGGGTPAASGYTPGLNAQPIPAPGPTPTVTAAPPTTQAAPSPTVQTSPAYTPDYSGLIQSDPAYAAATSAAGAAQTTAAAARAAALRSAVIRYGGAPSGFTDTYGDIDQATKDAAQGNQQSTIANLHQNYQQSVEQFRRALAARGALQSGDLNYGQDQLDRGEAQQEYDAANSFLDSANSQYGAYAGVLGQNAQNLAGAVQGAESNVYSNAAYRPTPAQSASYDAGLSATYGQPIYTDSAGNQYDVNGNPYKKSDAASSVFEPTGPGMTKGAVL